MTLGGRRLPVDRLRPGQFIALAERVSGQQLDELFDEWLFTGSKPASAGLVARSAAAPRSAGVRTCDAQFNRRLAAGHY